MSHNTTVLEEGTEGRWNDVLKAQEHERQRIASDLHDRIGSRLSAVKFSLESLIRKGIVFGPAADHCNDIVKQIHSSIEEVRRISTELCPSILSDFGLLATIQWFCREYHVTYAIAVDTHIDVLESDVSDIQKMIIFRVLQEAMNNTAKHARATRVKVVLKLTAKGLSFSVSDNGIGFNAVECMQQKNKEIGKSYGLYSMRRCVELTGGVFHLETVPGKGTTAMADF